MGKTATAGKRYLNTTRQSVILDTVLPVCRQNIIRVLIKRLPDDRNLLPKPLPNQSLLPKPNRRDGVSSTLLSPQTTGVVYATYSASKIGGAGGSWSPGRPPSPGSAKSVPTIGKLCVGP